MTDLAGAMIQLYAYDAYGNAVGFDPATALTEFLYSGEQFDAKIGQQYLRQRYYDPSTGRFNRLDPFFGNHSDPQSFHKYAYVHGDPVNNYDPTGLMSLGCVMVSMTIGMTSISIGAPIVGAAILGVRGEISLSGLWEKMKTKDTWSAAAFSILSGQVASAGMRSAALYFSKKVVEKGIPVMGLISAMFSLRESLRLTSDMLSGKLPPNDAEQYVATLIASNMLAALVQGGIKWKAGSSENDKAYWDATPEKQALYERGQMLVSSKIWGKFLKNDITSNSFDDAVARGQFLKLSTPQRILVRLEGLYQNACSQITNAIGITNNQMTVSKWIGSGLTPAGRLIASDYYYSTFATINAFVQGTMSYIFPDD